MADNLPAGGRSFSQALRRFMELESAGGIALLFATGLALAWANSPWQAGYHAFWEGGARAVVNDGLMVAFFFVVGLEIKRELVVGELRDPRAVGLPVLAAVGGMVVPAAIYGGFNAGGPGSAGWGIPMATDIAFALGVASLLGDRIPSPLKLFLLTLAIADDIGAILVIAVFYSGGPSWSWLTLAGVALGLLTPARPSHPGRASPAERLEGRLHPWTSFGVVPVFALANAGVTLGAGALGDALSSPVGLGIVAGLVGGKTLGVTAGAWVAVRLRLGRLPEDVTWPQLVPVATLAGIGFTVSLFVAGLAFDDPAPRETATLAVLVASALAALAGAAGAAAVSRGGRGSCR
ncbi:MAG: Na+/H+ antiporter NhaA [Acidimicrobiia bacterium]